MNYFLPPLFILLAFTAYSVLHSILASLRVKAWARRTFGEGAVARYYRLFFNLVGVLTLLPVLWLAGALPDRQLYAIPFPWVLLTAAGQLYGAWILLSSVMHTGTADFLGLQQALARPDSEPSKLKTDGFYARMRHPLYTGSMLVLWLLPVLSANALALVISFSLYFWVGAIFEERKLERYFGNDYKNYKARTLMFVPLLKR